MFNSPRVRVALILVLLLGLGAVYYVVHRPGQAASDLPQQIPTPGFASAARATDMGPASKSQVLHLTLGLPLANQAALQQTVDDINKPGSPNFHKFLTPEQVGDQFGLPMTTVDSVSSYMQSNGCTVDQVTKNRLAILTDCTVGQTEAAFQTTFKRFHIKNSKTDPGNADFIAPAAPLTVPLGLPHLEIAGAETHSQAVHRSLTPTQTRTLYNLAPLFDAGNKGLGAHIAISSFDGFRLSNLPLFYAQYNLPTPAGGVGSNVHVVPISGGMGSGTPGVEGDLDIQMVLGQAPLADLTIYDGGGWNLAGVLSQEVSDNVADVITESYGWSLGTASTYHNLHLSMSAQGITYVAATGDTGTDLQGYDYPNIEPEVLQIGGTVATTDTAGNRLTEDGSHYGGGWSLNAASFNVRPAWQVGTGVPTDVNYRMSPDVSLNAGTPYEFFLNGSLTGGYSGTSFSSPVFAGALADIEVASGMGRQGNLAPLIYSQNGSSTIWHDVTTGNNGNLPNGNPSNGAAGWDTVTGWGVPDFNALAATLKPSGGGGGGDSQAPSAPTNLIATAPSSTTVNLSWTASTDNVGVTGYQIWRNGVQVHTTTGVTYSDTGLSPNTMYSYFVKAYDAAGNVSAASNTATVTTPNALTWIVQPKANNITTTSATINDTANVAVTLTIEYWTGKKAHQTVTDSNLNTVHNTALAGLVANTNYSFKVVATDPTTSKTLTFSGSFKTRR